MYVAYTSIKDHQNDLFILYDIPLGQAIALCGEVVIDAGLKISIVYLVVGIADYAYQKFRFNEEMKMTKQEVKDEIRIPKETLKSRADSVSECARRPDEG